MINNNIDNNNNIDIINYIINRINKLNSKNNINEKIYKFINDNLKNYNKNFNVYNETT